MKISVVQVNLSNNTPKSSILVDKNVEVSGLARLQPTLYLHEITCLFLLFYNFYFEVIIQQTHIRTSLLKNYFSK